MMSTCRNHHLFTPFIRDIDTDCSTPKRATLMTHTWKNTQSDTQMHSSHPLCPASGSCSMKSGFFLLSLETFFQPVEGFFWELAHIQEHSGFTAVLQRLNAAYGAQVPLFHH